MQLLLDSIEITVLSLQLQRLIEADDLKKQALTNRIKEYEQLADHFKTILENSQKHD